MLCKLPILTADAESLSMCKRMSENGFTREHISSRVAGRTKRLSDVRGSQGSPGLTRATRLCRAGDTSEQVLCIPPLPQPQPTSQPSPYTYPYPHARTPRRPARPAPAVPPALSRPSPPALHCCLECHGAALAEQRRRKLFMSCVVFSIIAKIIISRLFREDVFMSCSDTYSCSTGISRL